MVPKMISGLGSIAFVAQQAAGLKPQVDGAPAVEPVQRVERAPRTRTAQPRQTTTDIASLVRLAQIVQASPVVADRSARYAPEAEREPTGQRLDRSG